jgi:nitrite reductase (NADH) large subunit
MAETRYVIVGNGMAGITAAQEIRRADPDGHIHLVGDEGEPYYYRASLSEWISGQTTDEMLPGRIDAFYKDMDIRQVDGHVIHVSPEAKTTHLAGGETLPYDKLLIATGARANTFPIRGLQEILVFRKLQDAREIKERVGCCGRVLILGGGILGLELAGALHKMGIEDIAVVQRSGYVGRPLLDEPAAEWLQAQMRADGITLFLNDTVERVEGQTACLYCKRTWEFDLFVQTVGITPCFPKIANMAAGKGIRVDEDCRTNLPDIYAAGDCTETRIPGSDQWQPTRIWLDCARQGKTAGRNMAGVEATLSEEPFFNASVIYTSLYSFIGEPHGEGGEPYVWQSEGGYRKVRIVDGKLAGALLLEERHGSMALFKAIGQPVPEGVGEDIARPDFPFNDLTGRDWDYMFY